MAVCYICGRKTATGHKVSHSNKKAKRTWRPNLQRVKADLNGTVRRIWVCTRCLKAGKVKRAL